MVIIHKRSPKEPKMGQKSRPGPEVRRHMFTKKGSLVCMAKERGEKNQKETGRVGCSNNRERTGRGRRDRGERVGSLPGGRQRQKHKMEWPRREKPSE